jgi:hypothetical protein
MPDAREIAETIVARGAALPDEIARLEAIRGSMDDLKALADILGGVSRVWWRKLKAAYAVIDKQPPIDHAIQFLRNFERIVEYNPEKGYFTMWSQGSGRILKITHRTVIVDADKPETIEAIAKFKGLGVHRGIGGSRKKWVVTHLFSGKMADEGHSSPRAAIARMRKLASMDDWYFREEEYMPRHLRHRVRRYHRNLARLT